MSLTLDMCYKALDVVDLLYKLMVAVEVPERVWASYFVLSSLYRLPKTQSNRTWVNPLHTVAHTLIRDFYSVRYQLRPNSTSNRKTFHHVCKIKKTSITLADWLFVNKCGDDH